MTIPSVLTPKRADRTSINFDRSRQIVAILDTQDKQCYRNALLALPFVRGGYYVEGTVVTESGLPLEHAWLETPDGTVIDPTPCYVAPDVGPRTYFAGPRWTREDIEKKLRVGRGSIKAPLFRLGETLTPHVSLWIESKLAVARHLSAVHAELAGEPLVTPENAPQWLEAWIGRHWAGHVLALATAA